MPFGTPPPIPNASLTIHGHQGPRSAASERKYRLNLHFKDKEYMRIHQKFFSFSMPISARTLIHG